MKPHLLRITTVALSLDVLLAGQAEFMEQNDFRVSLASAGQLNNLPKEPTNIKHYRIPMVRRIALLHDFYAFFWLLVLIIKLKPDIVHTHTPKAGLLGMMAAKIAGVPNRIHTVGGLPLMTAKGWQRSVLIAVERLTSWCAMQVWPNSKSLLHYMISKQLCPRHKLKVIADGSSNGVDIQAFSKERLEPKTVNEIKRKINYQENNRYLLAIGRLVKDKGIDDLVAAFKLLHQQQPHLRLLLIGRIEEIRKSEKLATDTLDTIQKHSAIQYICWTNEIASYLSLADLLIHASYREGFPNVLLQAGAMACPIVCTNIDGNTDIVTHRITGLTFPAGDIQSMFKMINLALRNTLQTQTRSLALRKEVEQKFTRKRLQKALLAQYNSVLGQKKPQ
ncbi:MAG: glycosyltransferase family 4 protein [Bacteroidota bacterium]